jgi:glycosyltransferase involved in cell wall biosynthesis
MAPEMFASFGGVARMLQVYLRAVCELEAARGRSVRLLALNDDAVETHDTRRCGAGNLSNWYVCGGDKRRFIRQAFRMSRGCERIICGHAALLPVAWAARVVNPRLRYSVVAHGIEVWRPFSILEKLALRGADHVICVSDFTRREMLKHVTLRPDRVAVLPNAIDTGLFPIAPGRPLAECRHVILAVSRLSYADSYKGVDTLIEAMPSVRAAEPGAELRIVGRGDDLPHLQSIARKVGLLGTGVSFLGSLDDKSLAEEMRSCRLFALPSGREGFGLVYLEAMANGRPCLGARAGGVPEVITEKTGVLVEFGDVPAIAAGCIAALRQQWDERLILDRARQFSYENFRGRLNAILFERRHD